MLPLVGAAMFFVSRIGAVADCSFCTIHASGTIKQCEKHAIKYNEEKLRELFSAGLLDSPNLHKMMERSAQEIRKLNDI